MDMILSIVSEIKRYILSAVELITDYIKELSGLFSIKKELILPITKMNYLVENLNTRIKDSEFRTINISGLMTVSR
jgi:hypothetical protein